MPLAPAVLRASAILDLVALEGPQKLADMARRLDLPKSSLHGLCETLCHLGLLHESDKGFTMGGKALLWAGSFHRDSVLVEAFEREVAQRPSLTRYSINLSILDGNEVVYLACKSSHQPLGITFQTGMRALAVYSATGKALLAELETIEHLITPWPAPLTPYSVKDAVGLAKQLAEVRKTRVGIDQSEMRAGMLCLGAVIHDPYSQSRNAAVALSMTEAECPPEEREAAQRQILELAEAISRRVYNS